MKKLRMCSQFAFFLLVVIGVFFLKGNAERWCPFGGVEAIFTYIQEGNMVCSLGVSNFYILAAVLLITLVLKRAFCGYMCPIGTISEWIGNVSCKLGLSPWTVPTKLDKVLSILKYAVLATILFFTYQAGELLFRGYDPCYALISRHGEDITIWSYVVAGSILFFSVFIRIPFCRWFCPLAAVLNPFSRFAFTSVRRGESCVDCGKCAKACPMAIPVDKVSKVNHSRCLACMNCLDVCPKKNENAITWGPSFSKKKWSVGIIIPIFLFLTSFAIFADIFFPLPSYIKERGEKPKQTKILHLEIKNLGCRGRANALMSYLNRDDDYEISGYLKLEAWPNPQWTKVHITYDPTQTNAKMIKEAIMGEYFDVKQNGLISPGFQIKGYDPLEGIELPKDMLK